MEPGVQDVDPAAPSLSFSKSSVGFSSRDSLVEMRTSSSRNTVARGDPPTPHQGPPPGGVLAGRSVGRPSGCPGFLATNKDGDLVPGGGDGFLPRS